MRIAESCGAKVVFMSFVKAIHALRHVKANNQIIFNL
jgi:hypothetical protein